MKILAVLFMLLALPATAGQVYRWVDAQGNVNYTDKPPPPGTKSSTQKSYRGSAEQGSASPETQQAKQKAPVTLYATADCGVPCDRAKAHLTRRNISYTTKDPSTSVDANEELRKGSSQPRVPTLMIGSEKLEGYAEATWDAAFDKAGYPAVPANNP